MIKRTSALPIQVWKGQVINMEVYSPYVKFKESEWSSRKRFRTSSKFKASVSALLHFFQYILQKLEGISLKEN